LGCDLVAVKGDEIIIAELKKTFNIKLLYQAVRRLAITPRVYAVIFKPHGRQKMSFWQMTKSLSRRLHIGLLMVDGNNIQSLAEPGFFSGKSSAVQKRRLLKEFHGRRVSENVGGVTGVKLQTAYLESAIHISVLLKKHKTLKPTEIVAYGVDAKAQKILSHNYYGWFEKTSRGVYCLKRGKARVIAAENPTIWAFYEKLVATS